MQALRLISTAGALAGSAMSAFAADAVFVPEPEPVEYVRICDVYGSGFFYIPGTETCLRVSGYVRYEIGAASDEDAGDTPNYNGFTAGRWNKNSRARLNVDARSDTEWGTLRSYLRFQASWSGDSDGLVRADQGWLSLGGLRMGYSESAWADTVIGDVSTQGSHSDNSMSYGDQQRQLIQYNFESNGVFGVFSLESDDFEDDDNFMPDVVGVLGYASGWGGVWARAGYDENFNESTYDLPLVGSNDGGFGASVGLQVNVPNTSGSSFRLVGYYADGDHIYGTLHDPAGDAFDGNGNSEFSALASYYHQFTPSFGASVGFQYFSDFYVGGTDISTGLDGYSAELSLVWVPVDNFEIRSEIQYDEIDTYDGTVSGYLRFTRSF